jgi:hypothetical protein
MRSDMHSSLLQMLLSHRLSQVLVCTGDYNVYAGGDVATGRVSLARQAPVHDKHPGHPKFGATFIGLEEP